MFAALLLFELIFVCVDMKGDGDDVEDGDGEGDGDREGDGESWRRRKLREWR